MIQSIKRTGYVLVVLFIACACNTDDGEIVESGEFPSFGTMRATINGEVTTLSAKKAKQFSSPYLQVVGTNCSRRILVGFDIPFSTGTYSLEELGDVFVFL